MIINLVELPLAILLKNEDGSEMSMMDLFHAGKEIMWPILLLSFVGITVVVERILFIIRENGTREAEVVEKMLESVEKRDIEGALAIGKKSKDFIAYHKKVWLDHISRWCFVSVLYKYIYKIVYAQH